MYNPDLTGLRLVADTGGTNARLALARDGVIVRGTAQNYINDEWDSLYAIIEAYLALQNMRPDEMVIAVAGPVNNGQARLTNRGWLIETSQVAAQFECGKIHLLNDLNALGYATPTLKDEQLRQVRARGMSEASLTQSLVVGVGTGFNVSPVLEKSDLIYCPAVEAGHVTLPSSVSHELSRAGIGLHHFETVEMLFSGRGFTVFCQQMTGEHYLEGRAVISAYGRGATQSQTAAVDFYAQLFGRLLGDLSMAYMPTSGIYLAGSVARALMHVAQDVCIAEISRPGQISGSFNPPIWVIEDDGAALIGCLSYVFD